MAARSSYINAVIGQLVTDHGVEVDENDETIRVGLEFEWAKGQVASHDRELADNDSLLQLARQAGDAASTSALSKRGAELQGARDVWHQYALQPAHWLIAQPDDRRQDPRMLPEE